jgi:hypothetical protein
MLKTKIIRLDTGRDLFIQFNPEKYETKRSQTLAKSSPPGSAYPRSYYSKGDGREYTFSLFYDGMRTLPSGVSIMNIRDNLRELLGEENSNYFFKPTPVCSVALGNLAFRGVLMSLDEDIELYTSDLNPLVMKFNLTWWVIQ